MKEILKLVEEIESWNDGDGETARESDVGICYLDESTINERAKIIEKLKKMLAS